jgi:DNA invertase Pin-like site-specific DNA recombinase
MEQELAKVWTLFQELGSPETKLVVSILDSISAYHAEVRKERQMAGIAKAKAEGKRWGGSVAGTRPRISPEKAALVRSFKQQGRTVAAIGRLLGLSRKAVYSVLKETCCDK